MSLQSTIVRVDCLLLLHHPHRRPFELVASFVMLHITDIVIKLIRLHYVIVMNVPGVYFFFTYHKRSKKNGNWSYVGATHEAHSSKRHNLVSGSTQTHRTIFFIHSFIRSHAPILNFITFKYFAICYCKRKLNVFEI